MDDGSFFFAVKFVHDIGEGFPVPAILVFEKIAPALCGERDFMEHDRGAAQASWPHLCHTALIEPVHVGEQAMIIAARGKLCFTRPAAFMLGFERDGQGGGGIIFHGAGGSPL